MHAMILSLAPWGFFLGFGLSVLHELISEQEDDDI